MLISGRTVTSQLHRGRNCEQEIARCCTTLRGRRSHSHITVVVVVVVVTFFNHNFVNCKATLICRLKIYETKYNISLNDVDT